MCAESAYNALGRQYAEVVCLAACLVSDREAMHNAILEGQPIGSNSRLGQSMDQLWTRLIRKSAPAKTQRSWRSIFSFLRR